ncbi:MULTISPECIES: YdeI/OmpD-associated family protein [unclassified Microbacterium]|uniref:YdeI/OmpD-associated family protein n=1 Tax=unclassified Microbacterium TaxID=2609290 RepID=UPI00214AE140|nr:MULTISPECIES: YdeI/OmpD-associated family protein [unclassified Microbacterium]MCR2783208.1 YdeI/OmpD-associated family protein [Microbacterium sp. zg.B96]MDL5352008.1 YdeI/OmpD-associated family protein [Microbacterium sp. zg-YB36]WIM15913.1 YdeI/OmpD-associated family protein [Microbacterium sp. zg-B96]
MGVLDEAEALRATDAAAWRAWLEEHHATSTGVWLLRPRAGVAAELVGYDAAVRQALCFGWVDGTVRPYDAEMLGQWYAPRRPGSGWAATNKARVIELEASGEMTDAGRRAIEAAKASGAWELLDGPEAGIEPAELTAALDAVPAARANWDAFPRSARKMGLTQIAMAKRPETKSARIAKLVADAVEGKRP